MLVNRMSGRCTQCRVCICREDFVPDAQSANVGVMLPQAANAAASAEGNAMGSANHARIEQSMASLAAAMAAMALFAQVRLRPQRP